MWLRTGSIPCTATALGLSPGTVRTRLREAGRVLRTDLADAGVRAHLLLALRAPTPGPDTPPRAGRVSLRVLPYGILDTEQARTWAAGLLVLPSSYETAKASLRRDAALVVAPWKLNGTVSVLPALAVPAAVRDGVKRTAVSGSRLGVLPATRAEVNVQMAATRVLTPDWAGVRETSTASL
ncbi:MULTISPECIES: helix-turn-helix domain-containing protein [unclassified Streptomyces]|uniref:helix-turn-helix domain-containing protein n=1 Tax=unclassified Streptomyces TaxID=2593676 RepID=UPI001F4E0BF5|nr:helix-turn-helix domain-containing protein [Streptomyces sp. AmelKG-D3]